MKLPACCEILNSYLIVGNLEISRLAASNLAVQSQNQNVSATYTDMKYPHSIYGEPKIRKTDFLLDLTKDYIKGLF